ncbi:MAG TPA: Replicase polyprotein 1ab [Rugosimonospora sp.]|nr:Replicase polyprotein 1ab [Rugosimonospora sp.]
MARRLVAAGTLVDSDPELALEHAVAARRLASRLAVVREAVGIAAYHAGEWATALAELRTYHRMTGRQSHLAVLADCERALGRPERAVDIYRTADRTALDPAEAVELLIVAAGARRDLGQAEAAVSMLQVRELGVEAPYAARLRYAYADGLLALDRRDEAREWFSRAVEADEDGTTDAAERLLELDGITITGDDLEDEEELDAGAGDDLDDLDGDAPGEAEEAAEVEDASGEVEDASGEAELEDAADLGVADGEDDDSEDDDPEDDDSEDADPEDADPDDDEDETRPADGQA